MRGGERARGQHVQAGGDEPRAQRAADGALLVCGRRVGEAAREQAAEHPEERTAAGEAERLGHVHRVDGDGREPALEGRREQHVAQRARKRKGKDDGHVEREQQLVVVLQHAHAHARAMSAHARRKKMGGDMKHGCPC
eukprot:1055669-Pleurochrysis_carterae.AAC.2